jgi:hypothetical protein
LLFIGLNCFSSDDGLKLIKDNKFPQWLKVKKVHTSQTSGIAYFPANKKGEKTFLLADDKGSIFRLTLRKDESIKLNEVKFSSFVEKFLNPFPKKDFEEIVYDKYNNQILLSIEGNDPDFKKYAGIFKLSFENNNIFSDRITSIEKLVITPEEKFLEYTNNNVGFEGLAVDDKYIYAGLESTSSQPIFSRKTKIYIINKKTLAIVKTLDTEELEISSISGLFCPDNHTLLGINRNARLMFYLKFDSSLNVIEKAYVPVETSVPGYPDLDYNASLESITMDDDNNVYFVDDPWPFFRHNEQILSKLDRESKNNFLNLVPVIYKFKINLHQKR